MWRPVSRQSIAPGSGERDSWDERLIRRCSGSTRRFLTRTCSFHSDGNEAKPVEQMAWMSPRFADAQGKQAQDSAIRRLQQQNEIGKQLLTKHRVEARLRSYRPYMYSRDRDRREEFVDAAEESDLSKRAAEDIRTMLTGMFGGLGIQVTFLDSPSG